MVKKARNVPATKEQKILNQVPDRLISKKVGCTETEPEEKLWKLNCITYSVAVAWRHVNDDYQGTSLGQKQRPRNVKCGKEILQRDSFLSNASGEHEAIQKQPKMTKRRVKRRKQNSAKCRTLFVKDLTEFIEKIKQQFPNSLNIHDVVAQRERLILVMWIN